MSMYRQLWLAIIVSMLLALGGSLLASTLSARSYLESQLAIKNSDNAQALALSLSQSKPDAVLVELAVSALFDGGHYESIHVVDPLGKTIVERHASIGALGAPAWFVRLLPINAQAGHAQISNGWAQFGTITLISHSRFAYAALWKSVYEMIASLTLAGLIGGCLASLVLRRLRRPLNTVIAQAAAIAERRFMIIEEPNVPELKQLAIAMNTTVSRLKRIFDEEATRLETFRRDAHFDALTGLLNRSQLITRANNALRREDAVPAGGVMLTRIATLAGINRAHGREIADALLRALGTALSKLAEQGHDRLAGRLNGADLVLFAPGESDIASLASLVHQNLKQAAASIEALPEISLPTAATSFVAGESFEEILSRVDVGLLQAEISPLNPVLLNAAKPLGAIDNNEIWRDLIRQSLADERVMLAAFPVRDVHGALLHWECPARIQIRPQGEWFTASQIMPWASKMGIMHQLDMLVLRKALEKLSHNDADIGINLSATSLLDPGFSTSLFNTLNAAPVLAKRLWIEFPETQILKHLPEFRAFCQQVHPLGCKIGIEHAGHQIGHIGEIYDLGLHYIKIDGSIIHGIDEHEANQVFLRGICLITHSIGLLTLAEGVHTAAELALLPTLGIEGMTGSAVSGKATT